MTDFISNDSFFQAELMRQFEDLPFYVMTPPESYFSACPLEDPKLLEEVLGQLPRNKPWVALSSINVYGEGVYQCGDCGAFRPTERPCTQFKWEFYCPICQEAMMPLPISETLSLAPLGFRGKAFMQFEQALNRIAPQAVILRLGTLYDLDDEAGNANFFYRMKNRLHSASFQAPLMMDEDGNQTRSLISWSQFCEVLHSLKTSPLLQWGGVLNCCQTAAIPIQYLAAWLYEEASDPPAPPYTITELQEELRVRYQSIEVKRLFQELGLSFAPLVPFVNVYSS
jgi:nucleoside-diphosphate-sugar epimerase